MNNIKSLMVIPTVEENLLTIRYIFLEGRSEKPKLSFRFCYLSAVVGSIIATPTSLVVSSVVILAFPWPAPFMKIQQLSVNYSIF